MAKIAPKFVIDCSITMAWFFKDEATPATNAILYRLSSEGAITSSVWPLEVANVLVIAERRGRLTQAETAQCTATLKSAPISINSDAIHHAFDQVLSIARERKLSSYDASYLEVAMRLGLPLATLDRELRRAAVEVGVTVL